MKFDMKRGWHEFKVDAPRWTLIARNDVRDLASELISYSNDITPYSPSYFCHIKDIPIAEIGGEVCMVDFGYAEHWPE